MKDFIRIYSYAGAYGGLMRRAVVAITLGALLGVIPYFVVHRIIMDVLGGGMTATLLAGLSAAVFLCLSLKTVATNRGLDASHQLAYDTLAGMRKRVADKLLRMPMGTIAAQGAGNLKKNFVENIEDMELILAHAIPEGISNIITFLVVEGALLAIDWRLALLALAVLPIGLIAVFRMVSQGMSRMGPYYQASKEMNDNIIEYVSGMEVIKVFGRTASSFRKYSDSVEAYRQKTTEWYGISWTHMVVYSTVLPFTLLFLLPLGTLFYLGGSLALGDLVLCCLLALSLGGPLVRIVEFIPMFPQLGMRAQKIEQVLAEPEIACGSRTAAPDSQDVAFDHVTFAYGDEDVLHDVSFTAKAGTVTALVGESGAGKSTLAKLLLRFWDHQEGSIRLGGVDIRDFTFETLMGQISYVSQDIFLFNTSILENIRMGRPGAADDDVVAIAKIAQCHEFITGTEGGYHTVVGGAGDKLSGGQRQRIAIARAMLQGAPLVVLDEATSFTDPENEDKIQEALGGLIRGKTLIVIAHRLSTIVDADNIVVMDAGRLADQGTHTELLRRCPVYRRMWQSHIATQDWDIAAGSQGEEGPCLSLLAACWIFRASTGGGYSSRLC